MVTAMGWDFEWDEQKAITNRRKHKVSFGEAKTIFDDPFLATFPDESHSVNERRYISVGASAEGKVLVVAHTERGNKIRIINCRKATTMERRAYEEGEF